MKKAYKTLIVDDHGVVVNGIKTTLNKITESTGTTFEIYFAANFTDAISILNEDPPIELVFLDIKLPPEPDIEMFSGEDLGMVIRKLNPDTLIIVITAYNQPIVIDRIMDKFAPEGFFVKGDTNADELTSAITKNLREPPYYSSTVMKYITNIRYNSLILDKSDIRLLLELDKGRTLKEIGQVISLSKSGVAKKKERLKLKLGVADGNDRDLVNKARELCFI